MLLQNEIAGVGRRAVALILDLVVLLVGLSVITRGMVLSPVGMWLMVFAIAICYSGLMVGLRGQTLGKMAMGIRVILPGGGRLNYGQTFQRAVLQWLPIFGIFILLAILMPEELRNRGAQPNLVEQVDLDSNASVVSSAIVLMGGILWLVLLHKARKHPDGQAVHDQVLGTYVIKNVV